MMNKADCLSSDFAQRFPGEFARSLSRGAIAEIGAVLESLPLAVASAVAANLPMSRIQALCETIDFGFESLLDAATYDDATALVALLPRERRLSYVNALTDRGRRRRLLQFMNYPANSIGALVSDSLIRVTGETPVSELLEELRRPEHAEDRPAIVVEQDSRYYGMLNLWSLTVHGKRNGSALEFADRVDPLKPGMLAATAALSEEWRHFEWLPVVDHEQRLLGVAARSRVFVHLTGNSVRQSTMQASVGDMGSVFLRTMNEFLSLLLSPGGSR